MGVIASQITSLTIVYSIIYSGTDQRKYQSSASLAFVWGIHRGPSDILVIFNVNPNLIQHIHILHKSLLKSHSAVYTHMSYDGFWFTQIGVSRQGIYVPLPWKDLLLDFLEVFWFLFTSTEHTSKYLGVDMMSWLGNSLYIIGPLCGESTFSTNSGAAS